MTATATKSDMQIYIEQIHMDALLTVQQERELGWRIINDNDQDARNALIKANLRLVVAIGRKHQQRGVPLADLIAEGNMGLLRAAEGYDPARGVRFSTYATKVIEQSIRAGIFNAIQTCHVPPYMADMITKCQAASTRLQASSNRVPTSQELAVELGISIRSVDSIHQAHKARYSSLNSNTERHDHRMDSIDLIEDVRTVSAEESGSHTESVRTVMRLLNLMDSRGARVLKMRIGLDGHESMTLNQIGQKLGISKERVRQIETQVCRRLYTLLVLSDNHDYVNHRAA